MVDLPFETACSRFRCIGLSTPVMGLSLWGLSSLCETGNFGRSGYQMKTSRAQARGAANCGANLYARATDRGKEAGEWMGKRPIPSTAVRASILIRIHSRHDRELRVRRPNNSRIQVAVCFPSCPPGWGHNISNMSNVTLALRRSGKQKTVGPVPTGQFC